MTIVFLFSELSVFLSGLTPLFYLSLVRYIYYLSVCPSISFLSHSLTHLLYLSFSQFLSYSLTQLPERRQSAARVIGFRQRRFGNRRERNARVLIEYATDDGKPFARRNDSHAGRVTAKPCTRRCHHITHIYSYIPLLLRARLTYPIVSVTFYPVDRFSN